MPEPPNADLIRLRPRQHSTYLSRGRIALAARRDGFVEGGSDRGLFVHETRMLSRHRYLIDDTPLHPVAQSNIDQHSWLGYYVQAPPGSNTRDASSPTENVQDLPAQHVLEVRLRRWIDTRFHEEVRLTNYTQQQVAFTLELEVDADFASPKETREGQSRRQDGSLDRRWTHAGENVGTLHFDYEAEHAYDHQGERGENRIKRGCRVQIEEADSPPSFEEERTRIQYEVALPPHESWEATMTVTPEIDDVVRWRGDGRPREQFPHGSPEELTSLFLEEATTFHAPGSDTLSPVVTNALQRAREDLSALRLFDLDHGRRVWTVAAGLPLYPTLFGRDTLTTAWQAALLGPEMMIGTLEEMVRRQGTEMNRWRDEQPGRMLHEAHTGPLPVLNYDPRRRYYGAMTTPVFFPFCVSELWHWTGSEKLRDRLLPPALDAVEWLDEYGDLDGDGFYEYKTASEHGVKNQGWKDSPDAIVAEDGSQVEPPIATCELQGFAYAAKRRLAELCWWTGRRGEAKNFYQDAKALKERFNEAFWMEEEGFFAMGLGPDNDPIRSIGSNVGHCLATGIVEEAKVERVVGRLFDEDMFTGWGLRTLSAGHPAYNPYSYHRGSVWPVEHGTFALGLMRVGLVDEMHRLCRAQFEAASLFDHCRLPEAFSGHARTEAQPFPAFYPQANAPQAWSASGVLCMVQALLGIYPYAPLNLLLVDPHLPEWLPELTVEGLRVGDASVTIRFFRTKEGSTSYEVTTKEGPLHVVRQPSPWSLTAGFGERVQDALASFVPGT